MEQNTSDEEDVMPRVGERADEELDDLEKQLEEIIEQEKASKSYDRIDIAEEGTGTSLSGDLSDNDVKENIWGIQVLQ